MASVNVKLRRFAKLSNPARRILVRKVTKNPKVNLTEFSAEVGEPLRRTTVSVTLHQSGFYGGVVRWQPQPVGQLLLDKICCQMTKCLQFFMGLSGLMA